MVGTGRIDAAFEQNRAAQPLALHTVFQLAAAALGVPTQLAVIDIDTCQGWKQLPALLFLIEKLQPHHMVVQHVGIGFYRKRGIAVVVKRLSRGHALPQAFVQHQLPLYVFHPCRLQLLQHFLQGIVV